MGSIGDALFGGSRSKQQASSTSSNLAYPGLSQAFGGQISTGTGANTMLGNLLGLGNTQAGVDAFNNYRNSAGYQAEEKAGTQAITNNNAARGLLQSGDTLKSISQYGTDLTNRYYNNYLQDLLGLSGQGVAAGGLLSDAGRVSSSSSSGNSSNKSGGMGKFLGAALTAL